MKCKDGSILLTKLEVEAIYRSNLPDQYGGGQSAIPPLKSDNKREQSEWIDKAKQLGFLVGDDE